MKNTVFVLKEGVEYRIKISFKVRMAAWGVNVAVRGARHEGVTSGVVLRSTRRSSQV